MNNYKLEIIDEINENILTSKELNGSKFFNGVAHGLARALALMNIINESQDDYITKCIENKEKVNLFELDAFKDGEQI